MVDNNHMQADGATSDVMTVEPVPEKLEAFGFAARRVDANSIDEVGAAFAWAKEQDAPVAPVCENLPGKGVPSFEVYERSDVPPRGRRRVGEGARGARVSVREELPEARSRPLPIARPSKIVAVGLNYVDQPPSRRCRGAGAPVAVRRNRPSSLIGDGDAIRLPPESEQVDFEASSAS